MKTLKLAVIGKDVSASQSPQIHNFIASEMNNSIVYDKISIPEEKFEERIGEIISAYDGFNVTIPYKLSAMPRLEKICGDAKTFGAVNTVRTADKSGYNTDGLGFALMLKNNGIDVCGRRALVLGAGGAGRSVAKKLAEAGAEVYVYDTRKVNALAVAKEFSVNALEEVTPRPYYLIVNATGIGMHITVGVSPVGADVIGGCEAAVDLIYTPAESEFLKIAKGLGKQTVNGAAMLFYQAYYSECIYFGTEPNDEEAKKLFTKYCLQ